MFQRPQQMARALARRGHRVFFCQKTQIPGRIHEPMTGRDEGVILVHDWERFERTIRAPLILWASWAKYHTLAGRAALTVFDSLDDFQEWMGMEQVMVRQADVVTCTSKAILESTISRRGRQGVHLLPNACDIDAWTRPMPAPHPLLRDVLRPRCVFSGYLGPWVDRELLRALARSTPSWNFILVGARHPGYGDEFGGMPNVHLHDAIPHHELPSVLRHVDAGIIPFRQGDRVVRAADPIKTYEYAACGLPILATDIPEVWKTPAMIGRDAAEMRDLLAWVAANWTRGDEIRSRAWAHANTWAARAARLEEIVVEALACPRSG